MFERIKIWFRSRYEGTIFSEAIRQLQSVWAKNKIAFVLEMFGIYLIAAYLTGFMGLAFFNLFGNGYSYSIINIVAVWLRYGLIPSFFVWGLVQGSIVKIIILIRTTSKRDERGYDVNQEHPYGDADFMSPTVMHKRFICEPIETNKATIFGCDPKNDNILVGQKHPQLKVNRNCFMVAGPSAGKSATFIIPLILQIMRRGESAIISDPKSELFKFTSELGKALGYEVRLLSLNPMFLKNSDPCNFLMYVGDDVDKAQVVANAVINTTTAGADMLSFWNEGALNLLQALILRITMGDDYKPEEKNLPQLFTYITTHDLQQIEADFEYLPDSHPAKPIFKIFKDGDDVPKKQVLQGLGIKLKLYNSPTLRKILSETKYGLDVLNPGRKRCLYFIGSNDQDSSMASVVSLFYTLEYQELVRYADMRKSGELPITVHMVLDEYANMASIPDFEKKLSTVRSRNIVTYVVVQDINQLKTKHPNDTWKTVMNDMDYFMLLKTNDPDTIKWWHDQIGEQTKSLKSKGYQKAKTTLLDVHNEEHVSEGAGQGYVMTNHQIRSLKDNEMLLLMTQQNVLKLHTFFWKRHPYAKFVTDETMVLPAQHYPYWRLVEDKVVGADFDYDNEPSYVIDIPMDDKFVGNDGYDPDAMLGIDSASKKVAKNVAKAFSKKKTNDDNGEEPQKTKKVTEIKVAHISKEEIEQKKNMTAQIGPSDEDEEDNKNIVTDEDGVTFDKDTGEILVQEDVEKKEPEEKTENKKGKKKVNKENKVNKGNEQQGNKQENKTNKEKNKKPSSSQKTPKLSETATEVNVDEYLSSSDVINEAEDL